MTQKFSTLAPPTPIKTLPHATLIEILAQTDNVLIIQDLDGVCMGLVHDPLTRQIDPDYVRATTRFAPHFYVLTNGEHIGKRGVNRIVEHALGGAAIAEAVGGYLPGLAAGGVQWQGRDGQVEYPGVSAAELAFLKTVPDRLQTALQDWLATVEHGLSPAQLTTAIATAILDNVASPTANLNVFYHLWRDRPALYTALQQHLASCLADLLHTAQQQNLGEAFFVHYAPNLGRDEAGHERLWLSDGTNAGTTDLQFMLRGAVKEAGVVAILNHYYQQRTGHYPLGPDFSARTAPATLPALLDLVVTAFDPAHLPRIIGVGDTVNSRVVDGVAQRGGSDRNFLQLIQAIGAATGQPNLVVYVDSSQGEVQNRQALQVDPADPTVLWRGPGDIRDRHDPLRLDVVFPGGHEQYIACFQAAAIARQARLTPA